uniref:Uncharacterized protein n=1 Tax=Zosterops lateralis melanops TaxID=1220523 RepID=A0A8D2P1X3_ZOSLA
MNCHRPNFFSTSRSIVLTSPLNTHSKPKPPRTRTHYPHCRNNNPNPMSIFRSYNPNNLTWTHLFNTILPSQH